MKLCKSSRVWQHPDFDHDTVPWGVAWWDPWGAHWDAPYTMPCLSSHSLISEAWSRAAFFCSKRWHWVWIGVRYLYHVGDEKSPWVWHRDPTWGYLSENMPGVLREVSSRGFSPSYVSRALQHLGNKGPALFCHLHPHSDTFHFTQEYSTMTDRLFFQQENPVFLSQENEYQFQHKNHSYAKSPCIPLAFIVCLMLCANHHIIFCKFHNSLNHILWAPF